MMKKVICVAFAAILCLFVSCGKKQNNAVESEELVFMTLNQQDTTDVINLVNKYTAFLLANQADSAMAMLHVLKNDSLSDVPAELKNKYKLSHSAFRPVRYQIDTMRFRDEKDCEVKFSAVLFEKAEGDTAPNTISFHVKPVRRNGVWYLTVADSDDLNTLNSRLDNYQGVEPVK
jgi:hypothetical protein